MTQSKDIPKLVLYFLALGVFAYLTYKFSSSIRNLIEQQIEVK